MLRNYVCIEDEFDAKDDHPLPRGWMGDRRESFHSRARRRLNSFGLTDDEVLVVAGNRIRSQEAEQERFLHFFWRPRRNRDPYEEWIAVVGHELKGLMRMAGEQEVEPVMGAHEYRARYSWYRKLHAQALRNRAQA